MIAHPVPHHLFGPNLWRNDEDDEEEEEMNGSIKYKYDSLFEAATRRVATDLIRENLRLCNQLNRSKAKTTLQSRRLLL